MWIVACCPDRGKSIALCCPCFAQAPGRTPTRPLAGVQLAHGTGASRRPMRLNCGLRRQPSVSFLWWPWLRPAGGALAKVERLANRSQPQVYQVSILDKHVHISCGGIYGPGETRTTT